MVVAVLVLGLIAFAPFSFCTPTGKRTAWTLHESRSSAPDSFSLVGTAPADQVIKFRINLSGNNLSGLEEKLNIISDPKSDTFRQWLTKEDVEAFATPSTATTSAVNGWLSNNGLASEKITPAGDWVSFIVPVGKAEEMLNTKFNVYSHKATGKQVIRTLSYSLPSEIAPYINALHPTTSFNGPVRRGSPVYEVKTKNSLIRDIADSPSEDAAAACSASAITPACLQTLYGIPSTPATNKLNSMGVTAYDDQYANTADLALFLQKYRTDMSSTTSFTLTSVDGGLNLQSGSLAGVEANLDTQYTVGLATDVPAYFVSVGNSYKDGDDEGFLDTINALLGETAPPLALSTSYGLDVESDLSRSLSVALCNSYMQLTSRGVSILFATGDGGVASTPGVSCLLTQFPPTFPTCPYVTLVGATSGVPETGASLSAGGFSNYFAQASWQASAVNTYFDFLGSLYSSRYNASGRGYPDVSSMGENVQVYVDKSVEGVAGTSCASPIFTSVVALLNDELLNAGKSVLGFLNPWLYANPQALNDITSGWNPGCGTLGFEATTGWDPVTGLGSPNYAKLRTAAGLV